MKKIPVVHGSIFRFEGQATVFYPYEGPCYRCLVPEPPPAELAPSCAEAGVLGVLPGIIGSIEAVEAIKLLLGLGESLVGRLLTYDALEQSFRTFRIRRDHAASRTGAAPRRRRLRLGAARHTPAHAETRGDSLGGRNLVLAHGER